MEVFLDIVRDVVNTTLGVPESTTDLIVNVFQGIFSFFSTIGSIFSGEAAEAAEATEGFDFSLILTLISLLLG